ncbi:tRNA pseudouridine(13) synthase TruD [Desulfurococcus mucosus]|uniref:tRNA pseudouridine synthase D TruD n=1 Tax=Desulfurococcus mucosus (strain ATCC 35584 / DSM 2162 / JCM 9187 / O7/1) TaxID=765177 RepID=E8RA87_DESM0|nr:tRNA pseudouridine(13) synthase TruD [Desulfurococcus mucosus]ADV65393.1 tRNA pseudouridine synthase D TruD [Desulfurococcus mucosus DSM 2162]
MTPCRVLYPHPLDYVTGLKYCLTDLKVGCWYRVSPDTFRVREIVDAEGFTHQAPRGRDGYIVLRVVKRGVDTFEALRLLSRRLGIPVGNIYFHGLKDRNATTTSYFYVKRLLVDETVFPLEEKGVSYEIAGYTRSKPHPGLFKGNEFEVVVDGVNRSQQESLIRITGLIEMHGLPSYYGYQRFGVRRHNTHLLGKFFLKHYEDLFAKHLLETVYPFEDFEAVLKRVRRNYVGLHYENLYAETRYSGRGLSMVVEALHGIIVDAYAGYLYNLLLNKVVEEKGYKGLDEEYPMPGCSGAIQLYSDIFKAEDVDPAEAKRLPCFHRRGLFKPLNTRVSCSGGSCRLVFSLGPGLYATVVLRELFKENLILY